MRPDIFLNRSISAMRLDGHSHESIALALAESAVDTLAAAGFSGQTLDAGIEQLVNAMRDHATELRALCAPSPVEARRAQFSCHGRQARLIWKIKAPRAHRPERPTGSFVRSRTFDAAHRREKMQIRFGAPLAGVRAAFKRKRLRMERAAKAEKILRPPTAPRTRILFLARHAPLATDYACAAFPGDGGYPANYHRVWSVLGELGYHVTTANQCRALYSRSNDVDLVFSLYNRAPIDNPEIFVAATCEFLHLPHVGAKPNIRALAEDKWIAKNFARSIGLPVADGAIYSRAEDLRKAPSFAGPYFVKNRFGAASEGISEQSIQDDWAGAARVAETFFARGMSVLVEKYAPGVDVTLPVLGGEQPLVLDLVRPRSDRLGAIVTEDLKRDDPLGYELFDAGAQTPNFDADALALWAAAGPMDYLRLDYRFDPETGRRVFLEFNICCHIGRSGAICLAGAQWGLSQADILGHVVEFSLRRQAREKETRRWAH